MKESSNPILDKSFDFALLIVEFCDILRLQRHYPLQHQLFRSGTAIGALIREALSPESRKDFIHKLKIASKEAEETEYWLLLCEASISLPNPQRDLRIRLQELKKILNSIIRSAKLKTDK